MLKTPRTRTTLLVSALALQVGCSSDQKPDANSDPAGVNEGSTTGDGDGDGDPGNNGDGDSGGGDGGTAGTGGSDTGGPDTSSGGRMAVDWADSQRDRARIFFSGHSLLRQPIQRELLNVATSLGKDLNYNLQDISGSSIRQRTIGADANNIDWSGYSSGDNREGSGLNIIDELRNPATLGAGERYDTLVITPRYDIENQIRLENALPLLRHYHDRINESTPGARTFFYHSWFNIRYDGDYRLAEWLDHERKAIKAWECGAAKVNLVLGASDRPLLPLPAGLALANLVESAVGGGLPGVTGSEDEILAQFFVDDVHPTEMAAYFLSLVVYSSVFGSEPTAGAHVPAGIAANTAETLREFAWTEVSNYYVNGSGASDPSMDECQSFMAEQLCDAHVALRGGNAFGCIDAFSNETEQNGFLWPDPHWTDFPAP